MERAAAGATLVSDSLQALYNRRKFGLGSRSIREFKTGGLNASGGPTSVVGPRGGVGSDMPENSCLPLQHGRAAGRGSATHEQRMLHDLRQSLTAVISLATIVDHESAEGRRIDGRIGQLHQEVERMREIVTAGQDRWRSRQPRVDVGSVVSQLWEVAAGAADCNMRLLREASSEVCADPVTLSRSIRNLIENAARAAGPGGQVEVRVLTRGHEVSVEVADDGPGFGHVAPQHGLGLLTVRRFAALHGGHVSVGSSAWGGALVRLHLPSARVADTTLHQALA